MVKPEVEIIELTDSIVMSDSCPEKICDPDCGVVGPSCTGECTFCDGDQGCTFY